MTRLATAIDEMCEQFLGKSGIVMICGDYIDESLVVAVFTTDITDPGLSALPSKIHGYRVLVSETLPVIRHQLLG